jgi:TonB family protein
MRLAALACASLLACGTKRSDFDPHEAGPGESGLVAPRGDGLIPIGPIDLTHGSGHGAVRVRRWTAVPQSEPTVILRSPIVTGPLEREVVRRSVHRRISDLKYCYGQSLVPNLAGVVEVQFTIAATGKVIKAHVQDSTIGTRTVETCIVRAVERWEFPTPAGGGTVSVSYAFALGPDFDREPPNSIRK